MAKNFNLDAFVRNALRRIFGRTPFHRGALERVKRVEYKGKRKYCWYTCAHCGEEYPRKFVHVDHIDPVVDVNRGPESLEIYVQRLFTDNLQILCKNCHKAKSTAENKVRREARGHRKKKASAV